MVCLPPDVWFAGRAAPHQSIEAKKVRDDAIGGAGASAARSGTGRAVRGSPGEYRLERRRDASTLASPPRGPTICRPNGMPVRSRPTGSEIAGCPTRVTA